MFASHISHLGAIINSDPRSSWEGEEKEISKKGKVKKRARREIKEKRE